MTHLSTVVGYAEQDAARYKSGADLLGWAPFLASHPDATPHRAEYRSRLSEALGTIEGMSKARKYQIVNVAAGLCCKCSGERVTALHCERHRADNNEYGLRSVAKLNKERLKKKLCIHCGEPAKRLGRGKVSRLCETHIATANLRTIEYRARDLASVLDGNADPRAAGVAAQLRAAATREEIAAAKLAASAILGVKKRGRKPKPKESAGVDSTSEGVNLKQ